MPTTSYETARDYAGLLLRLPQPARGAGRSPAAAEAPREELMQLAVDACWNAFSQSGISWIGFYLTADTPGELILGPRRDKPACSPIGLHGMCGRSYLERCPIIVRDVAALGESYIACDPRDRSELVIPLFETDGSCWGVLDADSYDLDSFGESDVVGLTRMVEHLGLSATQQHCSATLWF